MAKLDPTEFQEKHARRLKASLEDIRKGVEKVDKAPGVAAAAKQEKMKARINAAIDDGTWGRRVAGVPLEEWKAKTVSKGLPRISGGIDASAAKVAEFAAQLLPAIDAARAKVKKMPDLTLEDSIARMTAFTREMSKFRKK